MHLQRSFTPLAAAGSLLLAAAAHAAPYDWASAADGNWNDQTNWNDGASGFPDTADDTASINVDGTYVVNANTGVNVGDVALGTTSAAGKQTLSLGTFSGFNFANLTIGANGVFERHLDGNLGGTGTLTVQNGGLFSQANSSKSIGGHHLVVDSGGLVQIADGATLGMSANTNWTINGQVTGDGDIDANSNGHTFDGTGTIGGAGELFLSFRLTRWHGGLTVDRDVAATGAFLIANNSTVTINGAYNQLGGNRSFGAENNGESATVDGTGDINITATSSDLRFAGANQNNIGGGTLNFVGGGTLNLAAEGADSYISINANVLNIQRDATISGTDGGFIRITNDNLMNLSGAGNTLTINAGGTLMLDAEFHHSRRLHVDGGGELALSGGTILGKTGDGGAIVHVGEGSAGTLTLTAGTTSTFGASATGNGSTPLFRLNSNAAVNAGAGSTLVIADALVQIDITDGSNWNLDSQGELRIAGNGTQFEALSDDLGDNVSPASVPFSLNVLSFDSVETNVVFTLFDNTNNDGLGAGDVALYVQTLDLSLLSGGQTLELDGFGGAERVYFASLLNPNGVSFDSAEWVQIIPEPASLVLLLSGVGLIGLRRRV